VTLAAQIDPAVRVPWPSVILAAHGSRDPRSAQTVRALARAVGRGWGGEVRPAFLDFNPPSVPAALRSVAAARQPAIVVPLLLTQAYHGRVDVPEVVAAAGVPSVVTPVLGPAEPGEAPDPRLIGGLVRRLSELDIRYDGLVLAAAGTSYPAARSTVESVAAALGSTMDIACTAGYATASGPTVGEAVHALRSQGASRIAVASYFLAPGRLYDEAVQQAVGAAAVAVARPLGVAPDVVELVVQRAQMAYAGTKKPRRNRDPIGAFSVDPPAADRWCRAYSE
jgi:sirohydrochlorin ferrochelatase